MNIIRKKSGLIYLSICIALTVLIFLSCAIPQSISLQNKDTVAQAATVGVGTASVLNLNEKGEAQDYFSNVITGGQNEYIYIGGNISSTTANTPGYLNSGANAHTGAIKWRVLSVTDTKYNSAGGTWLLWADYMLGSGFYNPHYKNPYYAFWGNSMIRAKLNGGNYLSTVSSISSIPNLNQTVNPENSWVYNLFNIDERASFVRATDYETWNYLDLGLGTSTRECKILTNDARMVGANYYSSAFLTRVNDRGANVSVVDNTSVKEVYSGDYLFFIDFDDINNVSFGFGDSGVTYAKKVDSTWVSSQLSGYYGDGDITVSYLKEQTDIARDYWLRPAGIWGGTQKHSATVGVNTLNGCGTLPYTDDENGNIGVRPAFNFSPANVLYATASDTTSISDTFAPVSVINGGKPAYKLYLKNSGYKNYSVGTYADADMPKLTTGGSNVSVKMTGQSGSAVFLLADSSGNGEVKYQATANFNNGVATATLPSGVKASDYTVTVLFLDGNARGGEYAETVTASYTGLTVPEDESAAATQYYSGGNYEFKLSHVDDDLLDISLTYLGLNGVTDLPTSATATVSNGIYMLTAKEVGKYTVKIKPKSGRYWVNGTTAEKEYVFYIKYKVAELEVTGGSANAVKPYNGSEQSFALSNYDSDKMNVNTNAVDDLTFDGTASPPVFKATKAKKYDVDVELKDTTLMEWSGGGVLKKTVSVEIAKKKVKKPALSDPSATSKDYISQSSAVTFALTNYTGGSDVTITAPLSPLGASVDGANLKMLNAGTYSYRVELTDKDNTEWDDTAGGSLGYDITVTVNKKKIDKPEVSGDTSKEYTGSDVSFPLLKYTAGGDVTITAPTSPASASVDGTNLKASAVGIYNFTVSLTDTANTEWSNNGGTAPYTLTVSIGSGQIAKPSLDNAVLKLTDSKTYAQTGVTFTVYHTSSAVTITAPVTDPVGTASISGNTITVAQAGTYAFTVALTDSTNTEWVGGGKDSYTLTVTVDRMEISAPTFAPGADKKTYNGNIQAFQLTVDAAIEIRDSQQNVVTSFEAKDADTYNYTLHLKDTKNTQWQGANGDVSPKNISITIEKKTLNITSFTCSVSGNTPSWEKGESGVTFTVVEDSLTGDSVKLSLYIERGGNKSYDFAGVDESVAKTVTVTMPDYLTQGSYILGIELAAESPSNSNGNYVLTTLQSQIRKTFVVKGQGLILTEENMPWVYKYTDENQIENIVPIEAKAGVAARKAHLTYTGFEFEFAVNVEELAALGAEIDVSKGDNGFSGDVKYTNATTVSKTVTVYWKPAAGYEGSGGSYTLTYDIEKAKYDLSNTKWDYTNPKEYNALQNQTVKIIDLPDGLTISDADYTGNRYKPAGEYEAQVVNITNSNNNYYTPSLTDKETYIYGGNEFPWSLIWKITPQKLNLTWEEKNSDNNEFVYWTVSGVEAERIDSYLFYKDGDYDNTNGVAIGNPIELSSITITSKQVDAYWVVAVLMDSNNYEIESNKAKRFTVGSLKEIVKVELKDEKPFVYNGKQYGKDLKVTTDDNTLTGENILTAYYKNSVSEENLLTEAPKDAGKYVLVMRLQDGLEDDYELIVKSIEFEISKAKISAIWSSQSGIPKITDEEKYKDVIGYIYYDSDGNQLEDGAQLEAGKTYSVKAILTGDNAKNYEFVAEDGTVLEDPTSTGEENFTVDENYNGGSGNGIGGIDSGNQGGDGALDEILEKMKEMPLWQIISGAISIILTIIFLSKTASYDSKRKKYNKKSEKLDTSMYAGAYLGVAMTIWTAIACVLMGMAVISLVMMIIAKSRCNKAEEEYEERLDEYNRNKADFDVRKRDEDMKMMLMSILGNAGGNAGQGYAMQQGLGADDIRGIVSETMTAMLPGVQQMLPQQASSNDELVQKLIDQNEKLMQKLSEQPTEKVIGKEVVASSVNEELLKEIRALRTIPTGSDETILKIVAKAEENDGTIKQMMKTQEMLMERIIELSANQNAQPQVVEKIVEVPVEKIVEKQVKVEVPVEVEKIVEKVVEKPVEVEKIVEKEVRVEVPVEKVVEKVVEKEVKVKVTAPAKAPKEKAPRLTLDEAYEKLTKQQKKFFDGLREYAMSKDKCKEKKSTYFIVLGQSSVNPLIKLTVKKDTTVALFKMEDEYLKDIRRNAGSDGTKVKVKETEVIIGDAQAYATAKEMIDLREDQIERYAEYLKEQKAMR